jgi:uncharacterized protein
MDLFDVIIILVIGFFAGVINVMAGGGSLLTMPLLIFMGLDSVVANGTNRVAILFQNISSIHGFRSKGVRVGSYGVYLGISALLGAILGAGFAIEIDSALFNKVLAVVMVLVVIMTIINPALKTHKDSNGKIINLIEKLDSKSKFWGIVAMFFVGIYGGFIQAGSGLFIMAALTFINHFTLLKANAAKAVITLVYTLSALGVFIFSDNIDWGYGLTLAVGMSVGAWLASRWSSGSGEKYIKYFMIVAVIAMSIKLWFF